MRKIFFGLGFILLIPFLISASYGQTLLPPEVETHQRIVEDGYSQEEIQYFVILSIIAIIIPSVFLHPKMRKRFRSYGT